MTADAGIGKRLARWLGNASRQSLAGRVAPGSDAVMLLEDRILLDAEPVVTIVPTVTTAALGSTFGVTLHFDNVADADPGSTTGYAPYIDLVLPTVGKDGAGAAADDGITFGSATFLGLPVASTVLTFDAAGHATHPFAVDASGNPRIVNGTPGDTLVVLTLPFGSFTADQTPVDIKVSLNLSPLADFDPAHIADQLQISAQGGFALGRDPLNNPTVDPPVLQAVPALGTVSPSLVTLTKVSNAPEGETATGPNFEHVWTIDLDVASGQTITDAHIRDLLPSNIVYLGSTMVVGNGTLVSEPVVGSVVNPAANILDYDFGTLVGAAGVDARITVRFYVADVSGAGGAVIDPSSGSPTTTENDVEVEGALVPFDPRDPTIPFVEGRGIIDNVITNRSVAIQKNSAITVDNNVPGLSPGDVLTYTLNVQVSDFFTAGNIVLSDLLGDGQRLDTSFTPVFTVIERGVSTGQLSFAGTSAVGGELVGGNFTSAFNAATGATNLTIDVSNEIASRNLFGDGDGILAGGRTQAGDAVLLVGATTISVSFRAVVQNNFVSAHPGQAVNQGDSVGDRAEVAATIRDNASLAATGAVTDSSSLLLPIVGGALQDKAIVKVNGVDVSGGTLPQVTAGDLITFRVRYGLPTSAVENFKLADFLPLPVLPATQLTQFGGAIGDTPGLNQWNYGSGDTFHLLPNAPAPVASAPNSAANSFSFDYGSYAVQNQPGGVPQSSVVDLLFTVRVADAPFGDRLLLTNLITASEANSQGATVTTNAITQFQLTQPILTITKGVVDAAGGNTVTFQGSRSPASVSFAGAVGNVGAAAFTGTITDAALATGAINANLTGIDAGDKVTFAITINNNGTGRNGAFDVAIRDAMPAGFAIPVDATGLNLKVTTGAGVAVAFTNVGGGSGLFDQGIILTDGSTGAIAPDTDGSATTGTTTDDIIVITFDLVATTAVQPKQTWTNTATLDGYAALEGGTNFVPAGLSDTATVTTRDPGIAKVLFATDQSFTTGSAVAIGEVATFRVTYSLPEGTINAVNLRDVLPTGLTPVTATIVSVGSGITGPGVPAVGDAATLSGSTFNFALGNVVVAADNDASNDTIVVEVVARVADIANNSRGRNLDNSGRLLFTTTTETGALVDNTLTSTARVTVNTPDLALSKTVTPNIADEGDIVTYTLLLTNPSGSNATTAFDITTIDGSLVALGFSNIGIISVTSTGAVNPGATDTAGTITITADSLDVGGNITVRFTAQVGDVPAGTSLVNTARITEYSSLAGVVPGERVITNEPPVTATVTVPAVAESKTLITTSIGNDANRQVQIGETATFDIVATLPEGSTTLTITDLLPSGANVLQFVSTSVFSIGGNTTAGATSGGSLSNSLIGVGAAGVISGDGTTATFNFGTIKNTPDGVENAADRIIIRVTTLVPDVPANTAADNDVVNTAIATFDTSTTTATSSLDILEPVLTIVKSAPPGIVDAGARLNYSFVITNTGDGTAFDVTVADPLAANLTLVPGSISYSGAVSGTAASFADIAIAALAPGQSVTVSYQADVGDGIILGSTIVNTATTNYDSLPGIGNVGRVPNPPPSSSASVPTGGPVSLDKAIINTSVGNDTNPNVVIGEIITYRLTTTLPDGTTTLSLVDTLPSGLDYIVGSARVVSAFGASGVPATITEAGATTTFDFGSITNPGDNIAHPDQTVVVEIQARVADVPANQSGVTRTNSATATTGIGSASDTQTITILEPVLTIVKSAPPGIVDAGARLNYSFVITNTGDGTAFDVTVADPLAANLTLVPGSISYSGAVSGTAASFADIAIAALAPGQSVTVSYQADVGDGIILGSTIVNTATTNYDSLPGIGNVGRVPNPPPSSSASVPTGGPVSLDKAIINTSVGNDTNPNVVIGEIITYRLTTTLPDGTTTLSLTDTLPSGLDYIVGSARVVSAFGASGVPATITEAGATTTFDFGSITNPGDNIAHPDQTVVVEIQARVADVPANQNGVTRTNSAVATTGIGGASDTQTITIIEPVLGIDKTASTGTAASGDTVTYRVTLGHLSASTADANDILLTDNLAGGALTLVPGSVVIVSGPGSVVAGSTVNVSIPVLALGQTTVIEYRAIVAAGAGGNTIVNTANAGFDSLPGPGGRPGSVADSVTIGHPDFTKVITATSLVDTGSAQFRPDNVDLAIGERVTYDLVVTLPTTTTTVRVSDTLLATGATGLLQLVGTPVITLGSGVSATIAAPTLVKADTNGDGVDDSLFWDFGNVVSASPGGKITITVTALTLDRLDDGTRPGNSAGDLLALPARLDFGSGAIAAAVSVDIVEPKMQLAKVATPTVGEAGSAIAYTVTLTNTGSAPAYDLALADVAAPGLIPVGAVTVTQGGTVTNFTNPNAVALARLMPGETATVRYGAEVDSAVLVGSTLPNTATIGYDSLPGDDPAQRVLPPVSGSALVTLVPTTPASLVKAITVAGTSDPNTGAAEVRPGVTDLGIGERATVVLTATLPRGTVTGVTITDTLTVPAGVLGFDPASVVITLGGTVLAPGSYGVTTSDTNGDGQPDQVAFTLASVTVPGSADPAAAPLTISYRATAIDVPANQRGDSLDLPATLAFATATGNATPLAAIAGVDLVTPTLTLGKTVVKTTGDTGSLNGLSPPTGVLAGTAGDIFTYTLTIGHASASNGPAYDLNLTDTLGSGLVLVAGSATTSLAGATVTPSATGLTVNAAALLSGQSFTVTYQARIADSVVYGSSLPNTARLDYDTLAGAGGRGFATDAAAAVTLQGNATLTKAVIATSNPLTASEQFNPANPDVTVGETITYRLVATLAEGTTPSLVITDRLPSGPGGVVAFLASARPVLGAGITAQNANPTPVLTDSDGDGLADTVRWDFGRVTNAGDNRIDAGDTITIDLTGQLADDPRNTSGDLLVNAAQLAAATVNTPIAAAASAAIDVVEPRLVIDKTVSTGTYFPGQVPTYTVTVQHAPGSTAAAADVVVRDLLPPELTLVPGSLVIVTAPPGVTPVVDGANVSLPVLQLGSSLVFQFQAVIGFTVDTTVPLVNTADVAFDSNPGPGGRPGSASDTAALVVQAPGIFGRDTALPGWFDDRYVEELPHMDAIYTGTAQPGARVTVRLADANGAPAGIANVTADAGGNWLALLPTVKATDLMRAHSHTQWFERSSLFKSPTGLEQTLSDGLGDRVHRVVNGSDLADAPYSLHIEQSPAGFALDDAAATNLRSYFAPAWRDQLFVDQPLSIGTVFRDIASTAIARDVAADQHPIGFGVNAFNAEFLASVKPGATR